MPTAAIVSKPVFCGLAGKYTIIASWQNAKLIAVHQLAMLTQ
jgi:hypothetical protein